MSSEHVQKLILASASPRRQELLNQINITPDDIIPADIDESIKEREKPRELARRLSIEKAEHVHAQQSDSYILAADTVVGCGHQVLDKSVTEEQAREFLTKLSGRRHHVYGGIALITPEGKRLTKVCETFVQFKKLNNQEIENYIASKEWDGKAGGYAIQGLAGTFVKYMAGSYSNVVGLSLYDTMNLLQSGGYKIALKS